MRAFLIGLILGALLAVGGLFYFGRADFTGVPVVEGAADKLSAMIHGEETVAEEAAPVADEADAPAEDAPAAEAPMADEMVEETVEDAVENVAEEAPAEGEAIVEDAIETVEDAIQAAEDLAEDANPDSDN
ncbi:hypothetical protein RMQ97_05080 [Maricaulis sp. D1M11]|uniref:hypothetical protein n=1 Tax=Maricaulis sp. D1M11 TaxID=3076117 RepID=UPI0039B67B51